MEKAPRLERVVILGLLPLLGASSSAAAALAALLLTVVAAFVVFGMGFLLRLGKDLPGAMRWSILFSCGFGTAWLGSHVVSYLLPVPLSALLYLQLSGLTPIVYLAVGTGVSSRELGINWALFATALPAIGVLREFLGKGTLFGYLIAGNLAIPADFFASPVGAFLAVGALVFAARIASRLLRQGVVTGEGA
jgi:hypothetical protein